MNHDVLPALQVPPELRMAARTICCVRDPWAKAEATRALARAYGAGAMSLAPLEVLHEPTGLPGRPPRPELVDARLLPRRGMGSAQGRAILLHALAHIEFNAINLALDALCRHARGLLRRLAHGRGRGGPSFQSA
jgi:uncharacterized ferritin-like protein (DUF455 family)